MIMEHLRKKVHMRLSDWETMEFELQEKYMPVCVNVPTI